MQVFIQIQGMYTKQAYEQPFEGNLSASIASSAKSRGENREQIAKSRRQKTENRKANERGAHSLIL